MSFQIRIFLISFWIQSIISSPFCKAASKAAFISFPDNAPTQQNYFTNQKRSRTATQTAAIPRYPKSDSGLSLTNQNQDSSNDRRDVLLYLTYCLSTAVTLCSYETFVGKYYPQQKYGMGFGLQDRMNDKEILMKDVPSYNEIMLQHRTETLPTMKTPYLSKEDASLQIYNAVLKIQDLKKMAEDYDWDGMRLVLNSDVFQGGLSDACNVLRMELEKDDFARMEIGFDWGSCAWRHCGAFADAQESIAELRNSLGLFEPFECLFCLDIVERSLRDIIAVIPRSFYSSEMKKPLPVYQGYKPQQGDNANEGDEEDSSIDVDFLSAIQKFRVDLSND